MALWYVEGFDRVAWLLRGQVLAPRAYALWQDARAVLRRTQPYWTPERRAVIGGGGRRSIQALRPGDLRDPRG